MEPASHDFLKSLLATPSPSGYEQAIQKVVRDRMTPISDRVTTDRHGNVFAIRNPDATTKVMLAGHCDQIGLMVINIESEGYLNVQPIGGWDMQILLGQYLTVWTKTGPVQGVVARKAIHLLTDEERTKVPKFQDIWMDIGAKDKAEAESIVRCGDPVTFTLGYRELRNNLAASPAMDDKVGLWVCMEAVKKLHGRSFSAGVYGVSTVAEEIGLRGATTATYAINPTVGIAVDVCHATDTPGTDKKNVGDIRCGAGPVLFRGPNINPRVFDLLEATATKHGIPVQVRGAPRATGTDANVMQISREGVAVGLIGIPNRYMHSPVEVIHLDDLENSAKLLAEFCAAVTPDMDFIP
ncbi:MAG: M42 family metallopeptidase [Gemmataceae bacterium]